MNTVYYTCVCMQCAYQGPANAKTVSYITHNMICWSGARATHPNKHQAPGAVEEEGDCRVQQDVAVEILMALVQHAAIVAGVDVVPAQGIEPICLGALGQRKTEGLTMIDSCKADPSRSSETSTFHVFHHLAAHSYRPASSGSWWDQCEILACPSSTSSGSRSCARSNASNVARGSGAAKQCWSAARDRRGLAKWPQK